MESCSFLGVYFQNHRWPLVSKIWKPSKNHWKQWSGGWKSLNGDGWMTPKPLKNHRVQWSVIKKVVNGDSQRGAKPSKNHQCQWSSREKPSYPIAPKKWPLFTSTLWVERGYLRSLINNAMSHYIINQSVSLYQKKNKKTKLSQQFDSTMRSQWLLGLYLWCGIDNIKLLF